MGTENEVLLDSLKVKDLDSKLDNRIKLAKKRIVNSIADGINMRKRTKGKQKYHWMNDDESDEFFDTSNGYNKTQKRVGQYQRLNDGRKYPRVMTNLKNEN